MLIELLPNSIKFDPINPKPLKQQYTIAEILVKGKWLTETGFEINYNVEIHVQQRIVITTQE